VQDENAVPGVKVVTAKLAQKKGKAKDDKAPLSPVSSEAENAAENGMSGMKKKKRKLGGKPRVYDIDNVTDLSQFRILPSTPAPVKTTATTGQMNVIKSAFTIPKLKLAE